jgi:hypothetical protein
LQSCWVEGGRDEALPDRRADVDSNTSFRECPAERVSHDEYQNSSCEDLKAQKEQPPDPQQAAMKQKVLGLLKSDPKMREQFLNKVAAPIANKMFECGMIP